MKITLSPEQRTRKELYQVIGVSASTLRRYIKTTGIVIPKGRLLNLDHQKTILELFSIEVEWTRIPSR